MGVWGGGNSVANFGLQESCNCGITFGTLMNTVVTLSTAGYLPNTQEHSGNSKHRWITVEHS